MGVLIAYSSSAHRNLDLLPLARYLNRAGTRSGLRAVLLLTLLAVSPARRGGGRPRCRADPGPGGTGGTPGGGPPDRCRTGRGAHKHPDRAAYRVDRGRTRPRPPRCAAARSWPPAPGTPRRCAQGVRGHASGQTRFSLPPRTDSTPGGRKSNGCCRDLDRDHRGDHVVLLWWLNVTEGHRIPARSRPESPTRCAAPAPSPSGARTGDRAQPSAGCCSVSGRMSMRQPVRRAARRAFWPSLPIARDSW